jgi:hypothetical protein
MKAPQPRPVASSLYEAVLARDGGCLARSTVPEVACFGRIDPHHLQPRGRGGADTADNLASLCRAHHRWVHDHPQQATLLGLLRSARPKERHP